jgi:hypothetical protein
MSEEDDLRIRRQRFMARVRRYPTARLFYSQGLKDNSERECLYCGDRFVPDFSRDIGIVAAPMSVRLYHQRAFCSVRCGRGNGYSSTWDQRQHRIQRTSSHRNLSSNAIFDRDGWRCYLCDTLTHDRYEGNPPDSATLDHVVPLSGNGTHCVTTFAALAWRATGQRAVTT